MVDTAVIQKIEHRDNFWYRVRFKFDQETIKQVKAISGSRWSETYRSWLIPFDQNSANALREIFSGIECMDDECKVLFGFPESETTLSGTGTDMSVNAEEPSKNEKVFIFENKDYIFIKVNPYNKHDRSFLAGLGCSRNFLDSGYWKILNKYEANLSLRRYFSGRLKNMNSLIEEINEFEARRRNKNRVSVAIEGKRITAEFEWNMELIDFFKTLPFHRWYPDKKHWTFAYNEKSLNALRDFCAQNKLELYIDTVPAKQRVTKRVIKYNDPSHRKCPAEMLDKLKNRRYSENTIKQYISMFEEFINFYRDISIEELSIDHAKDFISYLVQKRRISPSYQNISVNAIKFYFEKVLGRPRSQILIDRPRNEKRLPEVLTRDEVISMISAIKNLKHRFIIILLYSTGLRRGELLNLKCSDIDRDNMQIWVRGGKGKKDRYVQLGKNTLKVLEEYIHLYNPREYLIEGRVERYSASSIIEIIKGAASKAGIDKKITPHKFRHSYATHLLEDGVDIRFIQELLGHGSIKTTQIYSHVSDRNIKNIVNPIDKMEI